MVRSVFLAAGAALVSAAMAEPSDIVLASEVGETCALGPLTLIPEAYDDGSPTGRFALMVADETGQPASAILYDRRDLLADDFCATAWSEIGAAEDGDVLDRAMF